ARGDPARGGRGRHLALGRRPNRARDPHRARYSAPPRRLSRAHPAPAGAPANMDPVGSAAGHTGLSSAEAAPRLSRRGDPEQANSRSVASIVMANVLTLFNAIIGGFFILILSLRLWDDAILWFMAIVNSAIGIRQELKAKETLDRLALLVAPRARAIRHGRVVELTAEEVVPGDLVRVEPGDQLVADGPLVDTRGLTVDESLLTGESDRTRRPAGDSLLL